MQRENNQKEKIIQALLAEISHEIFTPLHAITGYATLAQLHEDDVERVREYHKKILEASSQLEQVLRGKMQSPLPNRLELESDSVETLKGKKILLAEDNEVNREIAQEILGEVGLQVDSVENGRAAVDRLCEAPAGYYGVILMDIQMPGMNGYEATAEIRRLKDPVLSGIPIIAMTANAREEDVQAAKNAGMNAHVAKPVDFQRLFALLKQYL